MAEDPWFAGWCGLLVNLSDIAAMGGTPMAVVNSLWCRNASHGEPILAGLRRASEVFGVPVVGGHTNLQSPYDALSVAVLGLVRGPVLSARAARPGDHCHLLIDTAGAFRGASLCWDAATGAEPIRLRRQLALMAELAADGSVHAAKDISMGGLVGTAAMFCEAAGCGLGLDLAAIHPPEGVALEPWLTCFPSFGFLLAARAEQETRLSETGGVLRRAAAGAGGHVHRGAATGDSAGGPGGGDLAGGSPPHRLRGAGLRPPQGSGSRRLLGWLRHRAAISIADRVIAGRENLDVGGGELILKGRQQRPRGFPDRCRPP